MLPCCCLVAITIASPSPRHCLTPPFARHSHHHVRRCCPTRTATAMAIAIGICHHNRYPYRCCCHHQRCSSRRRLPCLRRRCLDVSITADALAAKPLPPSFVMDPTAGRLRLAKIPRQRRRRRQQRRGRRRSATDATAPTPDAAWTTPSSAWWTGSSSALVATAALRRGGGGVRQPRQCLCL